MNATAEQHNTTFDKEMNENDTLVNLGIKAWVA